MTEVDLGHTAEDTGGLVQNDDKVEIVVTGTPESVEKSPEHGISDTVDVSKVDMSKEDMIREINKLKASISSLASNIRDTRHVVERYNNDNQYLQDYVGTLMKNNDLKK
ncbi:SCOCO-like protein 1 [[Candida] jaroonii]|uniref:SCOCO-like protein 1 n=1 Tax=[Candida] jaroonii TaxID=467808 RepID=A0ACA9YEK0_9ASCO|nr:SCOCO-like protein 1 [[Candida] jaroonii]